MTTRKIPVNDLINLLMEAKAKGAKTVEIRGTIIAPEAGNLIVISTEKQM
jgi:hypothetical protein